jgi:hypothetical protein
MKNKVLVVLSVTVGLLMVSDPMFAHHSESVNDLERIVTVTGTVAKFEFINPHGRIYLDVKDDKGNVEQWLGTGGGPTSMRRWGWHKDTLKVGDQLTMFGFPYKDGRKILLWLRLVRPNGEELPTGQDEPGGKQGRYARYLATHPNEQGNQPKEQGDQKGK